MKFLFSLILFLSFKLVFSCCGCSSNWVYPSDWNKLFPNSLITLGSSSYWHSDYFLDSTNEYTFIMQSKTNRIRMSVINKTNGIGRSQIVLKPETTFVVGEEYNLLIENTKDRDYINKLVNLKLSPIIDLDSILSIKNEIRRKISQEDLDNFSESEKIQKTINNKLLYNPGTYGEFNSGVYEKYQKYTYTKWKVYANPPGLFLPKITSELAINKMISDSSSSYSGKRDLIYFSLLHKAAIDSSIRQLKEGIIAKLFKKYNYYQDNIMYKVNWINKNTNEEGVYYLKHSALHFGIEYCNRGFVKLIKNNQYTLNVSIIDDYGQESIDEKEISFVWPYD